MGGGVERFSKSLFILFLVLSVLSFAACESRVDKFTRLMVQDYREHNVSDEELAKIYAKMSEAELEEAKIKIAKELGGDVFGGLFLQAMEMPAAPAVVPISEYYKAVAEELEWYQSLGEIKCETSDGCSVTIDLCFGYKKNDKVTATELSSSENQILIRDFIRLYINSMSSDDLSPQKENDFKISLRNAINDKLLTKGKIREIAITKLNIAYMP